MENCLNIKTILLPLMLFVILAGSMSAEEAADEGFEFEIDYGSIGGGINIFSNESSFEFSVSLLDFFMEHDRTNIGLEITPLKYVFNSVNENSIDENLYFLNGNLYWNPFDIKHIILGPFVAINYLSIENWTKMSTSDYIFSSGLRFLLAFPINDWKQPFRIIGSEIGYRSISGRHSFYFNINLDIILLIGILSTEARDVAEANEDYERQIGGSGPFVPREPTPPKPPFQDDRDIR
jgi:hypothetical protein